MNVRSVIYANGKLLQTEMIGTRKNALLRPPSKEPEQEKL